MKTSEIKWLTMLLFTTMLFITACSDDTIRPPYLEEEIKDLTTEEIREKIETEKAALTKMKMNHAVSPLENPMLIRTTRRNIARLMTELRKRELNK